MVPSRCGPTTTHAHTQLEFGVLGPLEVRQSGRPVRLAGTRQRALLAMLLLHANETLSLERLISGLWRGDAPPTAPKMIRNSVSQLRRLLEPRDAKDVPVLLTRPRGYELRIDPEQLDATRFERLLREAREAMTGGDAAAAAAKLRTALSLWRGPALADLADQPLADVEIGRLEELRLTAIEDRIEADLALGAHAELVSELEALTASSPFRERLRAHQMLALYRSGRQADALEVYQKTRQLLVDELGIEPSRTVQQLERAILLQDPALDVAVTATAEPERAAAAAPAPLPAREVRKTVSVVVADVTIVGERRDPEATRRPIARSLERVVRVVERHGGSVDMRLPGAVTAVFGIPAVHEDDVLRALRASIELRNDVAALDEELERDWQIRVGIRAAVNTGEVVVGDAAAGHQLVAGDAVEQALRLHQAAATGEILIGEATRRFAEGVVDVQAVDLPAGADTEPRKAWRLLGLVDRPPRAGARMVGRETELAQLRHAFELTVRERRPYLFTILGAAGIGKSRLATEFVSTVEGDATVLLGRSAPYGTAAFGPLAEIVRRLAGEDPRSAVARIAASAEDAEVVADRVAGAIGLVDQPSPREETFWAVRTLFEALARSRPLVLVFEDLHWAEPTFLELVEHIADSARDAPILVLCLARPELLEDRPSWGGGKLNATSILLGPLSEGEAAQVIDDLVAHTEVDAAAAAAVAEIAEGNPFFLEQMIAMLGERDARDGELAVPPTIQAVVAARLDRLHPQERAVLDRASVIGRDFSEAAVRALSTEDTGPLDAQLESLARRELIGPGGEGFRFRHMLLREVAYDSIPKRARAELHERFASWLEQTAGARGRELDETAGYHLEQAYRYRAELAPVDDRARGLARRAAERLAAAGRRAYASGNPAAAVDLLSRTAALVEQAAPGRAELLVDLGDALRESGDLEAADAVLAEAAQLAAASADEVLEAQVGIIRLRVEMQRDTELETDELLRRAEHARAVFERSGDERNLAKAWELLAWVPWFRCRAAEAETALRRALEHARRAGDTRTAAQALNQLVGALSFGPTPAADGIRRCEEFLGQPNVQRRVRASVLRALAGFRAMEGDFDEARRAISQSRAILQDLGLRVTEASTAETAGIVELLAGDPAAAERELRSGYERLVEMGDMIVTAVLAALLAQALYAQERDNDALEFTELSERAAAPDDLSAHVQWRAARAKVLARIGRTAEAEELALEAVALAPRTDFLVVHGDALMDLGEVLRSAGRLDDAASAVEEALSLYERKGNVVSARRARDSLPETAARRTPGS